LEINKNYETAKKNNNQVQKAFQIFSASGAKLSLL